jgi:hypothetical protein
MHMPFGDADTLNFRLGCALRTLAGIPTGTRLRDLSGISPDRQGLADPVPGRVDDKSVVQRNSGVAPGSG